MMMILVGAKESFTPCVRGYMRTRIAAIGTCQLEADPRSTFNDSNSTSSTVDTT
jgi:hypothetical protein